MAKNSSKDSTKVFETEGSENQFAMKTVINQVDVSRTPLNVIPDPSQLFKDCVEELVVSGFKDKAVESGLGSNRRRSELVYGTPARSAGVSRSSFGGFSGARVCSSVGEVVVGGGGNSRVSRRKLECEAVNKAVEVPHFEIVEDPSFWNDHNVQVLIRMRPLNNMEKIAQGHGRCLKQESLRTLAWLGHPEVRFTFDHIVCETISQEKLFRVAGLPMVDNCMSGYNSCMFAYGQTGSGKTYTMMGEISQRDGKLVDDCGITPRIFEYLFTRIKVEEENRREERLKYSCKCSFLEIYNEQITDLLEPSSTNLQLREGLKEGVYVENLTEYNVNTVDEVLKLLLQGSANRKVAGTDMNSESSRSHSVFTCIVESRWEKDSVTHLRFGRLNLVDLAGSERQRSSAAGERVKEASYINKSLSTLGLVIMSLVDVAHGKHRHVPYRDSRLTFLLQDSLGGNSKTTIIANVSPSLCAANETLSTLKFAQRAKLIQNNAKVNEDASGDVMALQRQIQMLKEQISILIKHQNNSKPPFQGSQTKQENRHALSREDVQCTKMLLKFREEKIKRLELLANGIISTDNYLMDENNGLKEEIQQLQAKIDRNPEVTRFHGCYEHGEREALLSEVVALHNQLLKTLEIEQSYIDKNVPTARENEDDKSTEEVEEYKCANSSLIRKVDELKSELSKYMSYSQTAVHPVETVLSSTDINDEIGACNKVEGGSLHENNDLEKGNVLHSSVIEELMDARTMLDTMKSRQDRLVEELQYVRQENDRLVETLTNINKPHLHPMLNHESDISENGSSQIPSTDKTTMDLQARLDKMTKDLEGLRILNDPFKDQVDLVHEEVENEAAKAILQLQEELASLQVKYHRRLCTMSEENNKLKRIVADKEDEVYTLHSDWEKASLELTSFLLDGSRSLKDASSQIESIACSYPRHNVWVGENVKKAATVFIEKEQTILQLEKNLVDAQSTIQQMQEKLNSLRSATIALTEIQYTETNKMVEVPRGDTLLEEENHQLMVQQIIDELVAINNRLDNMKDYFGSIHDKALFEDLYECATDTSASSSILSDDEDLLENTSVEPTSALVSEGGSKPSSSNQESEKAHLFLKKQFMMAYEAFIKLDVQLGAVFKDNEYGNYSKDVKEMQEARCLTTKKFVEENGCKASSFFSKVEEARATMNEADNVLIALLKANEDAQMLSGRWKQAAEEVMVEKSSLIEEIDQLKDELQSKDEEHAILKAELANSVSMLEGSFCQLQKEAEDLCHLIYSDSLAMIQDISHSICQSRSSLQDICAETMKKSFASLVVQQCRIGEYINKFEHHEEIMENVDAHPFGQNELMTNDVCDEEENYSALMARKEPGNLIDENLKLKKEMERKDTLLNGLLFDFSLLQESASTRKDIKDEAEKLSSALSQVQHELKMKTDQFDDMMVGYEKLECCLSDAEAALSATKSCLQNSEETVEALSYQNAELRSLLEDLYLKKSETEKQLEEQKEKVKALENEIQCIASSNQEQFLFSLEGITDDLKRVSSERDELCEQINSLQDRLEMAYAIADENEAIAVEARQESQASKIYAEQKEEEVKILENSVEELDSTINVLEKRVNEMEEELERHHRIRDSLEVELQSVSQRLLTVESFRSSSDSDNYIFDQPEDQISRKLHSRYLELQEAQARIKDLEDERAEQANEIKQCKEYISELVIHAEAQAAQYQQKYKSLEAMVNVIKIDASKSGSEAQLSDKTEKSLVRPRGSSSPFRCIGNLVQQVNTEKDQELSLAKLRVEDLQTLASNRQKEICMLNTKLAAAESMTHDVIRDLLGVKLDMTNYANLINQNQLQRFIEDAAQQTQEFVAMEQEIRKLKRQLSDVLEERDRFISEIHSIEADILDSKMKFVQLQGRDQMLTAQNEMLKADKTNLQRRAAELDDMVKKLLETQPPSQQVNQISKASSNEFGKRLATSDKLLLRVNNELPQYRRPDSPRLQQRPYRKEA